MLVQSSSISSSFSSGVNFVRSSAGFAIQPVCSTSRQNASRTAAFPCKIDHLRSPHLGPVRPNRLVEFRDKAVRALVAQVHHAGATAVRKASSVLVGTILCKQAPFLCRTPTSRSASVSPPLEIATTGVVANSGGAPIPMRSFAFGCSSCLPNSERFADDERAGGGSREDARASVRETAS
jgi:hypothetical protein